MSVCKNCRVSCSEKEKLLNNKIFNIWDRTSKSGSRRKSKKQLVVPTSFHFTSPNRFTWRNLLPSMIWTLNSIDFAFLARLHLRLRWKFWFTNSFYICFSNGLFQFVTSNSAQPSHLGARKSTLFFAQESWNLWHIVKASYRQVLHTNRHTIRNQWNMQKNPWPKLSIAMLIGS